MLRADVGLLGKAPVGVDTEDGEVGTEVGIPAATGAAPLARGIRIDDYLLPYPDAAHARTDGRDRAGDFVPHHARVGEKRIVPAESVNIGTTNADRTRRNSDLVRWQGAVQPFDLDNARLDEDCRSHAIHLRIVLSEVAGQCSSTGPPASRPLETPYFHVCNNRTTVLEYATKRSWGLPGLAARQSRRHFGNSIEESGMYCLEKTNLRLQKTLFC